MARSRSQGLAVLGLSLALHGALLVGARLPPAPPLPAPAQRLGALASRPAARIARIARVAAERVLLVDQARADREAGRLALGDFLLRANALDAEERDAPFDLDAARALYRARVEALREALSAGSAVRDAVPETFADLRYFGRPGGLMAEALTDRGGSCEQLSHLIAAAVHDAGLPGRVALRFYGGAMSGASHLAPVETDGAEELDLLTGRPAFRNGTRFPATDLVDAYARARGLSPMEAAPAVARAPGDGGAAPSRDPEPERPSLTAGYPQNAVAYPGTVPLYAARGVAAPGDDEEEAAGAAALEQRNRAHDCSFFVRMASLDPPTIDVEPGGARGAFRVELRKIPAPSELTRKAALLRGAEDIAAAEKVDPADRLMAYACLTALGSDFALDLALAGEPKLAELAEQKARDAASQGAGAIGRVAWDGDEGAQLSRRLSERFAGQAWLLLFLEGGERVVLDLARRAPDGADWGRVEALAALTVAPATRARAYEILRDLPRRAQVDVMHEIFHAHDHQRPWTSSYALPDDPTGDGRELLRAYRVFRGLASRLWEGQRPVDQTLAALAREARAARLDPEWEALFLDYYGKNVLGLYQSRPGGLDVVTLLARAVDANGHPALAPLRARLDAIQAGGRVGWREVL